MLPSLSTVILATLLLGAVPEAARVTERKKRALAVYDSQDDAPLVVVSEHKPITFVKVVRTLAHLAAYLGPLIFLMVTPSMELGPVGTFIRAHVIDFYLLAMLYGTLSVSRSLGEPLVSRSSTKLNEFTVIPCGENRQRLIPQASFFLKFPNAFMIGTVHGSVLITLTIASIVCGWPSRSFASGILAFYSVCTLMSRPSFSVRSGKASYKDTALENLIPIIGNLIINVVSYIGSCYDDHPSATSTSTTTPSAMDQWVTALLNDQAFADLTELGVACICMIINGFAASLIILAYRYDVSQSCSIDAPDGKGDAFEEPMDLDNDMVQTFSSTLSPDDVDIHGRRPVSFALMSVPRLSGRQLPTFTASLFCTSAVNIVVLIANIVIPDTYGPEEAEILRAATVYKVFSAIALMASIPLVVASALFAAWCFSPGGLMGLWTYTETWGWSSGPSDEEAQQADKVETTSAPISLI